MVSTNHIAAFIENTDRYSSTSIASKFDTLLSLRGGLPVDFGTLKAGVTGPKVLFFFNSREKRDAMGKELGSNIIGHATLPENPNIFVLEVDLTEGKGGLKNLKDAVALFYRDRSDFGPASIVLSQSVYFHPSSDFSGKPILRNDTVPDEVLQAMRSNAQATLSKRGLVLTDESPLNTIQTALMEFRLNRTIGDENAAAHMIKQLGAGAGTAA